MSLVDAAASVALAMLGLALLLCVLRLVRGPSPQDRILALDTMYVNASSSACPAKAR